MTTPQPDLDELAALIDKTINEGFWKPTTVADAILKAGYRKAPIADDATIERMTWAMWRADGSPDGVAKRDPYRKLARAALTALSQDPGAKETTP